MNVLYLTHRLPYAPNRGDRVRAFHMARLLRDWMDVELVSLVHDDEEEAQAGAMRRLGMSVTTLRVPRLRNYAAAALRLGGSRPLTHLLLDAPELGPALEQISRKRQPDVVLAYCSGMARLAMEPPLSQFPCVIDFVDVDSQKWAALAQSASPLKRWVYGREVRTLSAFERLAAESAHASIVVNERERDALLALAPHANVRVVPNGVELESQIKAHTPDGTPRVVFCGVMNYEPNVEAALWFARDVWPLIRAGRPDAQFLIIGSDPTAAIRRLASLRDGIEVTGTVPDVRSHLMRASVAVAPLRTARGVQNKVFEAIGCGLPAVVTSPVFEGLPALVRPACRVADRADTFAKETLDLLAMTPVERRALVSQVNLGSLGWERQLQPLRAILTDAAAGKRGLLTLGKPGVRDGQVLVHG